MILINKMFGVVAAGMLFSAAGSAHAVNYDKYRTYVGELSGHSTYCLSKTSSACRQLKIVIYSSGRHRGCTQDLVRAGKRTSYRGRKIFVPRERFRGYVMDCRNAY